MQYKPLSAIINTLQRQKVSHAVISPGSRSAPLTISLARNSSIRKFIISDERSAGFIALGLSLDLKLPVAVVCTSGTAVYNLAPAVAEAFYQNVPLILLTADRPPEWIDQADGQSIHQERIFGNHVKKFYRIPTEYNHPDTTWHALRMISEAVNEATTYPEGPVHLNFPFREPFYPDPDISEDTLIEEKVILRLKSQVNLKKSEWDYLSTAWNESSKIMIVAGQTHHNKTIRRNLVNTALFFKIPVLCDIISNLNGQPAPFIYKHDLFLNAIDERILKDLKPDLLITFGKSVLSKQLKLFLRESGPVIHWHIQESGYVPDTFRSLTHIIPEPPESFLKRMCIEFKKDRIKDGFLELWINLEHRTNEIIRSFFKERKFSELEALNICMPQLPADCNLHLSNSLPVRLANYIGLNLPDLMVFSNRGTSGIDGCTATALGVSLASPEKLNILITGDIAFFYDRNAFWHKYNISNFRIILLNNHGGGIFRTINGPDKLPELKEYFETDQFLNAENMSKDFNIRYFRANNPETLRETLSLFLQKSDSAAILEIETDSEINQTVLDLLKKEIKKIWK